MSGIKFLPPVKNKSACPGNNNGYGQHEPATAMYLERHYINGVDGFIEVNFCRHCSVFYGQAYGDIKPAGSRG